MQFSSHEILEMAVQIELNGMRFYQRAAEQTENAALRTLLLSLVDMEQQHKRTFAEMQEELAEAEKAHTAFEDDDEGVLYLRAFADGTVFSAEADAELMHAAGESPDRVLEQAIELEKNSIAFYAGLKDMVPARRGKQRVEQIIKEEMSHVRMLAAKRQQLAS